MHVSIRHGDKYMKKICIMAELRSFNKNYLDFYDAIKEYVTDWGIKNHPLSNVWFIESENSVQELFDRLKQFVDKDDFIFIMNVSDVHDYEGLMMKPFWKWLKNDEIICNQ